MSRARAYSPPDFRFDGGQQDTANEDGLELPLCRVFQNFRVGEGVAKRRKGCHRFTRATNTNTAPLLDGTNDWLTIPLHSVHTLKKEWTFEALVRTDDLGDQRTVYGVAHATDYSLMVYITAGNKVEAKVQDSAGTVVTLTSASSLSAGQRLAIQVVRNGTSLTLRVNGVTEDSETMADLDCKTPGGNLYIGRNNTLTAWLGSIDFVRCLGLVLPDQRYGRQRFPYPRAEPVLWNYDMEAQGTNDRVNDLSRFENHGTLSGLVGGDFTSGDVLCVQSTPVFGMALWTDNDSKRRVFVAAGNNYYPSELVR